ncbi:uncharacterized protein BXZ73DRAFT_39603 [Epithele typhae]|uniref:uncharacterized protein n=1 Tax=Epithele typhae TaxID=378194 RepID=UPI002007FC9C|nr:uncharacterized protein BXZ73DRAFT_39603 [Epithele typhae]KAH9944499.1 hypothetical protein BXZ73DRAFT_39603 [Epithele typhae]
MSPESPDRLVHRRRSLSASSPIPRRQADDGTRISTKRARAPAPRAPSYKALAHDQPEKWDVDQWRRGKRARRDSQVPGSSSSAGFLGEPAPAPRTSPQTSMPTLGLPSSSAAFQFFSQKPQKTTPRQARSRRARLSRDASPREGDQITSDEARRMRADALGELHRSVEEGGEGLLRRMQDFERAGGPMRPPHASPRRSWRRPTSYYRTLQAFAAPEQSDDDDDDIFIVDKPAVSPAACRSPPYKKRALSLSMMEVDVPEDETDSSVGPVHCDRGSSPVRSSGPSAYSSDDDGHGDLDTELSSSGVFSTPALSHTYSASNNSSVVSLSLLPCDSGNAMSPPTGPPAMELRSPSPPPSTATPSEKAIAALTLAIANGAAGLSDYEALRMAESLTSLDATHAGELWD